MKLRSGIKLIREIEGYGDPIRDCGRFDAVLKFYRNKGDALEFQTILQDPIPYISESADGPIIAWQPPKMHLSNTVFERDSWLARQADLLPGVYYSLLGMKCMGYRLVAIPPHLFAHSMHEALEIDRDSVVKMEAFLLRVRDAGGAQQPSARDSRKAANGLTETRDS